MKTKEQMAEKAKELSNTIVDLEMIVNPTSEQETLYAMNEAAYQAIMWAMDFEGHKPQKGFVL